jgi:hypothetical protein
MSPRAPVNIQAERFATQPHGGFHCAWLGTRQADSFAAGFKTIGAKTDQWFRSQWWSGNRGQLQYALLLDTQSKRRLPDVGSGDRRQPMRLRTAGFPGTRRLRAAGLHRPVSAPRHASHLAVRSFQGAGEQRTALCTAKASQLCNSSSSLSSAVINGLCITNEQLAPPIERSPSRSGSVKICHASRSYTAR